MLDSLYVGATGMNAQQTNVEVIANNLANVNTTAFKKNRVSFEDLLYRNLTLNNVGPIDRQKVQRLGLGVGIANAGKIFTDGELKQSGSSLDVAIRGAGFFEVELADGSTAYTRNGSFIVSSDGTLATQAGNHLKPAIQIPSDAKDMLIDATGKVTVALVGETERSEIGQIELSNFVNPGGLNAIGDNLFIATEKSGDPIISKPGEQAVGTLAQGFLEASNVKLIEELINLIVAQRAYEANSKVVQASDEMLNISNNLKR